MKWPYIVRILPPEWIVLEPYLEGYRFVVQFEKMFGDCHSRTTFCRTPEEVQAAVQNMLSAWRQPDHIAPAPAAKCPPKPSNILFRSFTGQIRKEDLI